MVRHPQMSAAPWERRIARAAELVEMFPAAAELLEFYSRVAAFQESVFEDLRNTGSTDLNTVARRLPELCALIEGNATLAGHAAEVRRQGLDAWEAMLRSRWEDRAENEPAEEFLSRALLQPYAEYLASRGDAPVDSEGACPFCAAKPVVGVLRPEGEGAKRSLICSLCAAEWVYRRIVCPNCGEADKDKLPIYKAEGIEHVRIEACESCHCYLKSVDMTINGLAVPVVDELATVVLNVWAEENGYTKIQTNLLGL
jgi:FdhE protein